MLNILFNAFNNYIKYIHLSILIDKQNHSLQKQNKFEHVYDTFRAALDLMLFVEIKIVIIQFQWTSLKHYV
jgi:hypothetical protein